MAARRQAALSESEADPSQQRHTPEDSIHEHCHLEAEQHSEANSPFPKIEIARHAPQQLRMKFVNTTRAQGAFFFDLSEETFKRRNLIPNHLPDQFRRPTARSHENAISPETMANQSLRYHPQVAPDDSQFRIRPFLPVQSKRLYRSPIMSTETTLSQIVAGRHREHSKASQYSRRVEQPARHTRKHRHDAHLCVKMREGAF